MRSFIVTRLHRLHDLRFANLSAEAERTYDRLYILAGALDTEGFFFDENGRQLTHDEIAYRVRLKTQEIKKALVELQRAKLIHVNGKGPQIVDWKNDQWEINKKRDADRERAAEKRRAAGDSNPSQDVAGDSNPSQDVALNKDKDINNNRVVLLLSADARAKVEKEHPEWPAQALEIANTKHVDDPVKYAAGVVRNWLLEGRASAPAKGKPVTGRRSAQKLKRKKLEGDALKAARERAAKEFLG